MYFLIRRFNNNALKIVFEAKKYNDVKAEYAKPKYSDGAYEIWQAKKIFEDNRNKKD